MAEDNKPHVPFHPAPSVGHEIGIMFGFMAFFVLSMGVYYVMWRGQLSLAQPPSLIPNFCEEFRCLASWFLFVPVWYHSLSSKISLSVLNI